MVQARSLYAYLGRHGADRLLALSDRGWKIKPNFHFGFIRRGFGHGVKTRLSLEDYIRYWTDHPIERVSLAAQTLEVALRDFVSVGMIGNEDFGEVVEELPVSAQNFNVIPGLEMLFDWPLSKAVEIDRRGGMVEEFTRVVNEALAVCGGEQFAVAKPAEA